MWFDIIGRKHDVFNLEVEFIVRTFTRSFIIVIQIKWTWLQKFKIIQFFINFFENVLHIIGLVHVIVQPERVACKAKVRIMAAAD